MPCQRSGYSKVKVISRQYSCGKWNAPLLQSTVERYPEPSPAHNKASDISIRRSKLYVPKQGIEGTAADIVKLFYGIIRENLFRCAEGSYMVPFHAHYLVGDTLGKIYLVQAHDYRDSTVFCHVGKNSQKLNLVPDVKERCRLVQDYGLSVQLELLGYKPLQISVDDFFVERDETPRDKNGEFDFEALEAIDLELFNKTLSGLAEGKEMPLPTFDFPSGSKKWEENSILVVEGIHCLNPRLTASIPDEAKYKIYVSALTSISIDSQNPIPTSDNRLIRRIVRDHKYRGYSALDTLKRWQSVRNGEVRNIFPYQENADAMINTALIYELGILKPYAVPVLNEVPETVPEYAEACRLLKFLSYFEPILEKNTPGVSIIREFVGGSNFHY